jgi:cytochrome c oxidase subunit 4
MTPRGTFWKATAPPLLALGALLLLLALTTFYALTPHWPAKSGVAILIASLKALIVLAIFMRLARASALIRFAAFAGLAWLTILFVLGGADYISRFPSENANLSNGSGN